MEIKRINENTIRCIVTKEDMQKYDIKIEDFIKNSSCVNEFLHTVIELAQEEVGFVADKGMLAMQVAIISPDKLAITFSDSEQSPTSQIMNQIKDIFGEMTKQEVVSKPEGVLPEPSVQKEVEKVDKKVQDMFMYQFYYMDDIINFCKNMPDNLRVKTVLYKDEEKGTYILVIYKYKASKKDFNRIANVAIEYADVFKYNPAILAYVEEHNTKIIAANVIDKLKKV